MKATRRVNAGDSYWVYGVHAVERRLEANPSSVQSLLLGTRDSKARLRLAALAARHGVKTQRAEDAELQRKSGSTTHQGAVAFVTSFDYASLGSLVEGGRSLLVVDQMQDPQNLGALVRSAAAAGFGGIVIPERGATGVTAAVEKASAGAVHAIGICRVVNVVRCLATLAEAGWWRLALVPSEAASLYEIEIPRPVVLVLGGETGIRRLVRERCDLTARIPQMEAVESLNASVAGAVAMFEVRRRDLASGCG